MRTPTSAHTSRHLCVFWLALLYAILLPFTAYSLSRSIGRDVEFPKDYDSAKATAIRKFVQDERFQFLGGTVSYWAPDYGTRLSYDGPTENLNEFLSESQKLPGIGTQVKLYRGRNDQGRRDSAWQLDYSHARPNQLTVYLNLNSPDVDLDKLVLPEWNAQTGPILAKRAAPKPVTSVVAGSIGYSAPSEHMGFVIAIDTQTKKELWRERIYTVKIDPKMERDVQDVFITSLALEKGILKITNERGEKFQLDLATRKVTPRK